MSFKIEFHKEGTEVYQEVVAGIVNTMVRANQLRSQGWTVRVLNDAGQPL